MTGDPVTAGPGDVQPWGEPLSPDIDPELAGDAVAGLLAGADPAALRTHLDAAARRALDKHLDALARTALTQALATEDGDRALVEAAGEAVAVVLDGSPPPDQVVPEPAYPNVADWLHDYLLPNYRRRMLHTRWCRRWFEHAEAITRLEAIWQAWEALRYDGPTGMAVWWRDYADPHLRVLTDEAGPFFDCDAAAGRHKVADVFPVDAPPDGLFRDAAHPEELQG